MLMRHYIQRVLLLISKLLTLALSLFKLVLFKLCLYNIRQFSSEKKKKGESFWSSAVKATTSMHAGTPHKLRCGTQWRDISTGSGVPTSFSAPQLEHRSAPGPGPAPDGPVSLQRALLTLWMNWIKPYFIIEGLIKGHGQTVPVLACWCFWTLSSLLVGFWTWLTLTEPS